MEINYGNLSGEVDEWSRLDYHYDETFVCWMLDGEFLTLPKTMTNRDIYTIIFNSIDQILIYLILYVYYKKKKERKWIHMYGDQENVE